MKALRILAVLLFAANLCLGQSPSPAPPVVTSEVILPLYTVNVDPMRGANRQVVGVRGQTMYYYWAVVNYPRGSVMTHLGGVEGGANATLSGSNYVLIAPYNYPAGATSVDFLRTTLDVAPTGACNCAVTGAIGVTSGTVSDTSNTLANYTVPAAFNLQSYVLSLTNEQVGSASHLMLRQGPNPPLTLGTLVADLSLAGGGSFPANAQTGDALRYNVYGDGAWDATSAQFGPMVTVFTSYANGSVGVSGNVETPNTLATGGSCAVTAPTATNSAGMTCTSSSSASASTVIGIDQGIAANYGDYSFGGFYRWSLKFAAGGTTNVRYWMGLTVFNTGGSGTETANPFNTTSFATNTPNRSTLGLRYAVGTDTAWQCTAQITGGSQTAVSTGVALDTNSHVFAITYDGTTERCFIDGALLANVTTNVPAGSVFRVLQFWVGDNQNAATAISGTQYWMTLALK